MIQIKFGTDGWRAIIAREYTVDNVARVAQATAEWMKNSFENPTAVVGNDCRFGGKMFSDMTSRILAANGVKVIKASNDFVSTPMISLAANKLGADAGIIITASHNPSDYNGYKIKAGYGGPAIPKEITAVEELIPNSIPPTPESLQHFVDAGFVTMDDFEEIYIKEVEANFDLKLIKDAGIKLGYDAMYGAGQNVVRRIFPDAVLYHASYNPSFMGTAPEPILKNLGEMANDIAKRDDIDMGLATDGDADRIGLVDENGNFVDSHHILLLLIHYLHKVKGMNGKIVVSFSCTNKIRKLAELYNIPVEITKIGFKYICGIMVEDDVLVGGEESGGIAIKGYIPERDGIWIGLTLMEYMAKSGKSLTDLIQEMYDLVGTFANERNDLHIAEEKKWQIVENAKNGVYKSFGPYEVDRIEDTDGYKFLFTNGESVMIRPSGTEPVLRVYAEAANLENTKKILEATVATVTA